MGYGLCWLLLLVFLALLLILLLILVLLILLLLQLLLPAHGCQHCFCSIAMPSSLLNNRQHHALLLLLQLPRPQCLQHGLCCVWCG